MAERATNSSGAAWSAPAAPCVQAAVYRVAATDGALDDTTYVCADDLPPVSGPGHVATRIERAE